MTDAIRHRGPDAEGIWHDALQGVVLGHRRLSIVDLSVAGAQPMRSASGRFVVAFNGEIYNCSELRSELERTGRAPAWRGHSDTEVMLAAIEAWGLEDSLVRFNGMFAFALWDQQERELVLARDRFGEKPLYLLQATGGISFASELKALRLAPGWTGEVDRNAVAALLTLDYVPAPGSIFRNVTKLPPASLMRIRNARSPDAPQTYWNAVVVASAGALSPSTGNDAEMLDGLESRLRRAVGLRMHADVPLGAFLSGGIDSSLVVAMMQAQSNRPVRTFSIGFDDAAYDEASHAAQVARHLGTDHTELIVRPADALAVVPKLPRLYDEPFADASQIPTYLVSALARRNVTVALSGDGGDELFGGYNRHQWIPKLWSGVGWVPLVCRRAAAATVLSVGPSTLDWIFRQLGRVIDELNVRTPGEKLHKLMRVLDSESPQEMYFRLASFWRNPLALVNGSERAPAATDFQWNERMGAGQAAMVADAVGYLPDDILVKLDRASMGVSLEARVPLLDPELFEYAWRLPHAMKIRSGVSKWALREVLYRHVPRGLIDRPKMGFGIPIDTWLRGPLRDWAESLLDERRLRTGGFYPPEIRRVWTEHLSGRKNWQYHLWSILMFEAWREEFGVV